MPAFLYFTRVAECSTRRKRTSWSSLPKWLRPFDPNGFHRHPSDQPPVRLHSELLQPFCKVSQPVLWLRTPRHCLRDTQPTTKLGLSLKCTEQGASGDLKPEERDCSPIEYLGIKNLPAQLVAEHVVGLLGLSGIQGAAAEMSRIAECTCDERGHAPGMTVLEIV